MQPGVDILLTYWGDPELFKQAVNSVRSQTTDNWRLLIFDDCYPSLEAAEYIKGLNDPRISYYRHEKNIGITNNFNYALNSAKSDFCILLGCDDRLLPTYLEAALANIGEADFYQPGVEVIDGNGNIYLPLADRIKRLLQPRKPGVYSGEKLAASLCTGNWLYFPSILWKTSTLNQYRFDPKYKIVEDVVVELSMIIDGATLAFDNTPTFQYRRFAHSLSSKEKQKNGIRFREETDVYNYFSNEFSRINWNKAALSARLRIASRLHQFIS